MLGKLPPKILRKYLLAMTGAPSKKLMVVPAIGIDFGVVKLDRGYMIVSSDPVTGVEKRIGWYAVNVSANDVATSGNRPEFIQSVILLPENSNERIVKAVSAEIHSSAKELGVTIVGGHTELTPGLKRPIVMTTAFAFSGSYVTAADAREGDLVMMTKSAGVEGTAILGNRFVDSSSNSERALARATKKFYSQLSVVGEAEAAFSTGAVHAMHDCTEGGVLGAVYEMAYASKRGFRILESQIPVAPETKELCSRLRINPLRLISSGTLLLAVKPIGEGKVSKRLAEIGVASAVIGRFSGRIRISVRTDGSETRIDEPGTDEIWRISARGARIS
ncbi:MAG: AIR synthase family protein [Thaumarchaeota archaeon]|nr:AIR synthase family protein [Nitrososphaerota archaeon]